MTIENKNSVNSPSALFSMWMEDSLLPRSLMAGAKGMKAAGEKFLPKNALETESAYEKRLEASMLLNAYKKTVAFLAGQVFQSDVIFSEEVSEDIVSLTENIDGKNNSIHVFAKRVFINGLGNGVSHILVDAPSVGNTTLTVAEEKEQNIRPYFKEVQATDLIGFRFFEDGKLELIRIAESVDKPDGKFGVKTVPRVRVYYSTGAWELYEKSDSGDFVIISSGMLSYKGIPLISFIPGNEINELLGETPLMDLAELNKHHWRTTSDQINILHIARVPLLFGRHISAEKIPVGTATLINSEDDNSDLKFVEITGASISAGAVDIKETEAKMALYGLQQLVPRTGNMTATEKAITSAESQSSLSTWAVELENAIQRAFEVFMQFSNGEFPKNGLTVNKEYNFGIANEQELRSILDANNQGILSDQAAFDEFKRRGIFDEHLDWDDIKAEIDAEAASAQSTANLAGTLFGNTTTPEGE